MNRTGLFSWLMFALLTIGYAVVHVVIAGWGTSVLQAIWPAGATPENLVITKTGEALIQSYTNNYSRVSYRRFDGTLIPDTLGLQKTFVTESISLSSKDLDEHKSFEPESWAHRLNSFHDFQKPATAWYLIAPPDHASTAYFVGYDQLSRQLVGYIGIDGFSSQQPAVNQSFPILMSQYSAFASSVAAAQNQDYFQSSEPSGDFLEANYVPIANAAPDNVWILSAGTLYEIRLGSRTVRPVLKNRPELRQLYSRNEERDGKTYLQLFIRTDTGLLIMDPETANSKSISLAPIPRRVFASFYRLPDSQQILIYKPMPSLKELSPAQTVFWLDANGKIERHAETTLSGDSGQSFVQYLGTVLCLPSPLFPFCGLILGAYLDPDQFGESPSFWDRYRRLLWEFKIWLIVSVVVGLGTGVACWRREREVFGTKSWAWPIVVGICGWFGWMGYICTRPLPARLPNRQWLPDQPESARPLGTEIFA